MEKNGPTCTKGPKISVQEDRLKKAGRIIAGLGKEAWRKREKELFFSAKRGQEAAFNRRSALRESLLEAWNVDMHKSLRIGEQRHVTLEGSEDSYVSFDKVDDLWPS